MAGEQKPHWTYLDEGQYKGVYIIAPSGKRHSIGDSTAFRELAAELDAIEAEVKELRERLDEARQAHNTEQGGFFWDEGQRIPAENVLAEMRSRRASLLASQAREQALREALEAMLLACPVKEGGTAHRMARAALTTTPEAEVEGEEG